MYLIIIPIENVILDMQQNILDSMKESLMLAMPQTGQIVKLSAKVHGNSGLESLKKNRTRCPNCVAIRIQVAGNGTTSRHQAYYLGSNKLLVQLK